MTYTPDELARARKSGDFILTATGMQADPQKEGVAFLEWLEGPRGAGFALLREPHHSDADVSRAKHWLRSNRDVVTLKVYLPAK